MALSKKEEMRLLVMEQTAIEPVEDELQAVELVQAIMKTARKNEFSNDIITRVSELIFLEIADEFEDDGDGIIARRGKEEEQDERELPKIPPIITH